MPKLCLALDTDVKTARELIYKLKGYPLVIKVGHRLFMLEGKEILQEIKSAGFELFLDLKFHDIPNTVALAVESANELGVDYLTLHTLGGEEMLRKAVERKADMRLLGVTLLTSHDEEYLSFLRSSFGSLRDMVLYLAGTALRVGVDGIVCSGLEVEMLKTAFGGDFIAVVPGIRLSGEKTDDQKRVLSPKEAVKRGADMLVMGRDILRSPEPLRVVERVLEDIEDA